MLAYITERSAVASFPFTELAEDVFYLDYYAAKYYSEQLYASNIRISKLLNFKVDEFVYRAYYHFADRGFTLRACYYGFDFALYSALDAHSECLLKCLPSSTISQLDVLYAVRISNQVRKRCVFAWQGESGIEFVCLSYVRQPHETF